MKISLVKLLQAGGVHLSRCKRKWRRQPVNGNSTLCISSDRLECIIVKANVIRFWEDVRLDQHREIRIKGSISKVFPRNEITGRFEKAIKLK